MLSESGTGTPSSSTRRLGAPAKGTAADPLDGGALTLGWTSPTDEQARERRRALLAHWPPLSLGRRARRCSLGWRKRRGVKEMARVSEERPRRGFVPARDARHRWSQMNGSHVFGLVSAQVGGEKVCPGLRRVLPVSVRAGADWN
jgi:hypothetical protein